MPADVGHDPDAGVCRNQEDRTKLIDNARTSSQCPMAVLLE